MQAVYEYIFSFSGGYNYLNRQVCSEFRQLIPKASVYAYLDQLLQEGKKDEFTLFVRSNSTQEITKVAIKQTLLSLLAECGRSIPLHICNIAAGKGDLKLLRWAKERKYFWDKFTYQAAVRNGDLQVLKYMKDEGWFHEREILYKATLCKEPLGMNKFVQRLLALEI